MKLGDDMKEGQDGFWILLGRSRAISPEAAAAMVGPFRVSNRTPGASRPTLSRKPSCLIS
jgi:hypothetical protein